MEEILCRSALEQGEALRALFRSVDQGEQEVSRQASRNAQLSLALLDQSSRTLQALTEVYFYFDLKDNNVVFHMMGEPTETRHLLMHNEQAVISPSWSIHTGVGTSNYTFIWGMCGENQEFDDMDNIDPMDLR